MDGSAETPVRCNENVETLLLLLLGLTFSSWINVIEESASSYSVSTGSLERITLKWDIKSTLRSRSALAYLAAATIFMDFVIFWIFLTDFRRIEMSWKKSYDQKWINLQGSKAGLLLYNGSRGLSEKTRSLAEHGFSLKLYVTIKIDKKR